MKSASQKRRFLSSLFSIPFFLVSDESGNSLVSKSLGFSNIFTSVVTFNLHFFENLNNVITVVFRKVT